MKKIKDVKNNLFLRQKNDFIKWYDSLTFIKILLIWTAIILFFGLIYHFFPHDGSFLMNNETNLKVDNIFDSIYFSFISATTTGFGDIVPIGYFKLVATLEVIFGLLLLALVTSKLVSIKQDVILDEIYELSLNEKINRIRSSLLLFRQNLSRVRSKIDDGSIRKREINDLYIHITSFEDILYELIQFLSRQKGKDFMKTLSSVNLELIINSVNSSLSKLDNLFNDLKSHKLNWKNEITIKHITRSLRLSSDLFDIIKTHGSIPLDDITEIEIEINELIEKLKSKIK